MIWSIRKCYNYHVFREGMVNSLQTGAADPMNIQRAYKKLHDQNSQHKLNRVG